MPTDNAAAWDSYASAYQEAARWPATVVHYGPDIPTEDDLRLLGDLRGKRVLELGCGGGQCSVAFARAGATAIGVDFSAEQLAHARRLAAEHEVRVELRHGDLADLAFLRADSIDLAFSGYAFAYVEDLGRVFRQVHRVLKVGAPLVFSLPHPAWDLTASYFERGPREVEHGGVTFAECRHPFSELFTGLVRASYRVDLVVEPEPPAGVPRSSFWDEAALRVPRTLIVRARKEGN
ncbi:MAG: class I SAM-dependent methyltransferase [Acidimicrobiales bacterium]